MTPLILKRAPVGDNPDDYSVLENGVVVGAHLRVAIMPSSASPTAPTPPSYESAPARDPVQMNTNNPTTLSPANNTANATGS